MKRASEFQISVDASTLGFKPGVWPLGFNYHGVEYKRLEFRHRGGDLECVLYEQPSSGRILTVLND